MIELKLSHFSKKLKLNNPLQKDSSFELGPINYTFIAPAIYGLLGSNGSGKSTLLRSIFEESKLLHSQSLELSPVTTLNLKTREPNKYKISFCDSMGGFDPEWRVNDILVFSRFSFHQGYPGDLDRKAISAIVELLNLGKIIFHPLNTLSSGTLQKVWLASSLVQEPDVLLLDEPTSHLDAKQKNNFMELLKVILKNPSTSTKLILLSSHDIHLCLNYCDYLIGLKSGKICYDRKNTSDSVQNILSTVYEEQ